MAKRKKRHPQNYFDVKSIPKNYIPNVIPSGIHFIVKDLCTKTNRQWLHERKRLVITLLTFMYSNPFSKVKISHSVLRQRWNDRDVRIVLKFLKRHNYLISQTPCSWRNKQAETYVIHPEIVAEIAKHTDCFYINGKPDNGHGNAVDNCLCDERTTYKTNFDIDTKNIKPLLEQQTFTHFDIIPDGNILKEKVRTDKIYFCLDKAFLKIYQSNKPNNKKIDLWDLIKLKYITGLLTPDYNISRKSHRVTTRYHQIESLNKFFRDDPNIMRGYSQSVDMTGCHPSIVQALHNVEPTDDINATIATITGLSRTTVKGIVLPLMNGQSGAGYVANILKLKGHGKTKKARIYDRLKQAKAIINDPKHKLHKRALKLINDRLLVIPEMIRLKALPSDRERVQMQRIESSIIRTVISKLRCHFLIVSDCIVVKSLKQAEKVYRMIKEVSKKLLDFCLDCTIENLKTKNYKPLKQLELF